MGRKSASAPKARLVDMEVEEVSLVDRAANKRKFLVVKRSEGMGQESNPGSAGEGTEGEQGHEGEDGAQDGDDGAGEDSPLDVAASAFDGVTSAMARLQSAGDDALRGELQNVVEELRGAANALEDQLSGEGSDYEADDDEESDQPGSGGDDSSAVLAPLVGAMTELVAELRAARTGKPTAKATRGGRKTAPPARRGGAGSADDEEKDDEDEEADDEEVPVRRGPPPKPTPKRKDAGARSGQGEGLRADMRALRSDLKTFSTSLAEQARRLTKLEKRASPPSSRPAGERPGASRTSDDAWPLDLNAPRSR
jgi:hypothetical protein